MIWVIAEDMNVPNSRIGEVSKNELGIYVLHFSCHKKHLKDYLYNNKGLLILSDKVINIMNSICANDFIATEINVFSRGIKKEKYYSVSHLKEINVLNTFNAKVVECEYDENYIYYSGSIWGKVDLITDTLNGIDIAINPDYKSHVLISDRLKKAITDIGVKELEFKYIRPEPHIVDCQGCITNYIWPDTGEEFSSLGDIFPLVSPDFDRIVRLIISWPPNKSLSETMFALRKTNTVFEKMPVPKLLQLVKNFNSYDFCDLQYHEAFEILEKAKKNGLDAILEE